MSEIIRYFPTEYPGIEIVYSIDSQIPELIVYGSKSLTVLWYPEDRKVTLHLDTLDEKNRIKGETTAIYQTLVNSLIKAAFEDDQPITCVVRPWSGKNMVDWCNSKGNEIFRGWDNLTKDPTTFLPTYTKTFKPE